MRITFTCFFSSGYRNILSAGFCGLMICLLYAPGLMAQTKSISGKVIADDGTALPGVNVIVKNSTVGTVTDIDGNYRINAPADAQTLTFSFIGFTEREVEIGNQTTIDVQMTPDVKQLSEVVVTGYTTQIKRDLTGNIARCIW